MPHPVTERTPDRFLSGRAGTSRSAVRRRTSHLQAAKELGRARGAEPPGSPADTSSSSRPNAWQRTGHAPVEADGCADPAFRAHYFHRDATPSDEGVDGFREWNDSSVAAGIELTGRRIHDDSDEGELFVCDPPGLKSSLDIEWARVGEEATNGWGKNFQPHRQSLPEVLDGREGRFFLRVYDSDVIMLDSVAFRHLPNLRQIHVNGAEYAQDTVLVPTSTGYPLTAVRFVGADGSTLSPVLPVECSPESTALRMRSKFHRARTRIA